MTQRREYYTLLSSLPVLPRFDRAERLPINLERLKERLTMLEPDDSELIDRATTFVAWSRQPVERSNEEMIANYHRMMELVDDPAIAAMVELRVEVRTIVAGLRRRRLGRPAPQAGEPWGVGRWVRHIEMNWDEPHFKLAAIYPWLPQAREHLHSGEALALERLLFSVVWDGMDRLCGDRFFGFERVVAYLFKWGILQRWLAYNVEGARARFDGLVAEAIHETTI